MVLVTANVDSHFKCVIDLSKDEWKSLNIDNLNSFGMEEKKCICSAYPDGIFPGAEMQENEKQKSKIIKFTNFIEYSKVVSEDTISIQGKLYLTSRFYDERKIGWSSQNIIKKKGEVIGYCVNGDVYCEKDRDQVYKFFYEMVYYPLIKNLPVFNNLKNLLNEGMNLELVGADQESMEWLEKILNKS